MNYQPFPLKYRPQKFSEVVGQKDIKIITNCVLKGEIYTGYLFAGMWGSGKTTTARILAKALNCSDRNGFEPCGKCLSCRSIAEGNSNPVLEIAAAVHGGKDNIKELHTRLTFDFGDEYKVVILDEAQSMTREGFEAFLKLLEEPPSKCCFILCTTAFDKIPPAIISRCTVINFSAIEFSLIEERLKYICYHEDIKVDGGVLRILAEESHGAMRDAIKFLEKMSQFTGKNITLLSLRKELGFISLDELAMFVDFVLYRRGDSDKIQDIIKTASKKRLLENALKIIFQKAFVGDEEKIEKFRPYLKEILQIYQNLSIFKRMELEYIFTSVCSLPFLKEERIDIPFRELHVEDDIQKYIFRVFQ